MCSSKRYKSLTVTVVWLICVLLITNCSFSRKKLPKQTPPIALQETGYEPLPQFKASTLLNGGLLQGDGYRVDEEVYNDGYFDHFRIISSVGDFDAIGSPMLITKLHETRVMLELDRIGSSGVFLDALASTGEGMVMGPIRGVQKLAEHVSDPDKLADTAASIPGGIWRGICWVGRQFKNGWNYVTGNSKTESSKKKAPARESELDIQSSALHFTGKYTGYNKRYKAWLEKYNIDPYTANEEMLDEMKKFSRIETGVSFTRFFLPGLPGVPFVGDINRIVSRGEQIAQFEDPEKLRRKMTVRLEALNVDPELQQKLLNHKFLTPPMQNALLEAVEKLEPVKNRFSLFSMAIVAASPEMARYFVMATNDLVEYHQKTSPLTMIPSKATTPCGITAQGKLIIPLPFDHVVWTKKVATAVEDFQKSLGTDTRYTSVAVFLSGGASLRVMQEASARSIALTIRQKPLMEESIQIGGGGK